MSEIQIKVEIDNFKNPKPIFEIITDDNHYKIYSNGFIEALDSNKKCIAINRIDQFKG